MLGSDRLVIKGVILRLWEQSQVEGLRMSKRLLLCLELITTIVIVCVYTHEYQVLLHFKLRALAKVH